MESVRAWRCDCRVCGDSESASGGVANFCCLFNHQVTLLHQWPDSQKAGVLQSPFVFAPMRQKPFNLPAREGATFFVRVGHGEEL